MKKIYLLASLFLICSCMSKPKQGFKFIYGFENKSNISNIDLKRTIEVVKNRLTHFGVDNTVKRFGKNELEIIIKADKLNIDAVDRLISNPGKLEFWELYKGDEFQTYFFEIDREKNKNQELGEANNPKLIELVTGRGYEGGPIIFQFKKTDTAYVNSVLNRNESKSRFPFYKYRVKFLWGISDESGNVPLYAAKSNRENIAPLTGAVITNAKQIFGYTNRPEIAIQMNKEGALIWERITGKAFQNATSIAITVNGVVHSAPGVTTGAIKGGRSSISGDFTVEEAQNLATILISGEAIPQLKLLEQTAVSNR